MAATIDEPSVHCISEGCSPGSLTELHDCSPDTGLALQTVLKEKRLVCSSAYGRGKLVERRRKCSGTLVFPPSRPSGALFIKPEELVRYASWMEEGELEPLDLSNGKGGRSAWQLLRSCHPAHLQHSRVTEDLQDELSLKALEVVYLTECRLADGLEQQCLVKDEDLWTDCQQERHFAEGPAVQATICIGKENRFQDCNAEKNTFGMTYHVREPRCKTLEMQFAEFSQNLLQWSSKSVLLKARAGDLDAISQLPVRQWRAVSDEEMLFALREDLACPEGLQKLVQDKIAWDWFKDLQQRHRMGVVTGVTLQVGGRNALLPAQYHTQDRFLAQAVGTRRVLLVSPDHSFEGLYPFPLHHPYDTYSMVDWEAPDVATWPSSRKVQGKVCVLKPGDLLFVPSCWWIHQQLLGRENATLEFTLGIGYRVRPVGAITLRVSRVVEELIGDIDGPGKVLYWLLLLGAEEERDVIDVNTVAGFKQIEAVWEARDAVDDVLGWKAWKRLFPAMCRGRLRPTPWLNKDFMEPLYLTSKPRIIEDIRTEEQRKYPELFRHVKA